MLFSCSIAFSTHSVINDLLTTDPQCLRKRSAFVDAFDNASPLIDARTRNSLWRITEIFDKSAKKAIDDCVDAVYAFIDPLVKERLEEVKPGVNDKNGDLLDLMLTQSRDAWTLSGWSEFPLRDRP